jgi:hypothetical protein
MNRFIERILRVLYQRRFVKEKATDNTEPLIFDDEMARGSTFTDFRDSRCPLERKQCREAPIED